MAKYSGLINLNTLRHFLEKIIDLVEQRAKPPNVCSITIPTAWAGTGPYTCSVSIEGGTQTSKVDLQPNATVISQLIADGVQSLYIVNNNGTFTAIAVGATPSLALTVQATITEVTI